MDQQELSRTVKAHWLQYYGLKVEATGKSCRFGNAARGPISQVQIASIPGPEAFMVAD